MASYVLVVSFAAVYYIAETLGLFSGEPVAGIHALYSWPMRIASLLLVLTALVHAVKGLRQRAFSVLIMLLATTMMVGGLWTSWLSRFSGEFVITEGQRIQLAPKTFLSVSLCQGRLAEIPGFGIMLEELNPFIQTGSSEMKELSGSFVLFGTNGGQAQPMVLSREPVKIGSGLTIRLTDFGYSPLFVLRDKDGRDLDSAFVYMRLFPSGSEDFFRLLSPQTYYVRYAPEDPDNKPFSLRIARNKDLIVDERIGFNEDVTFDNGRISFLDMRKWTTVMIRKDYGETLAFAGGLVALAYGILMVVRKFMKKELGG